MASTTSTTRKAATGKTGHRKATANRQRGQFGSSSIASSLPDATGMTEWMQSWLEPKNFADMNMARPTTVMQSSAVDVWEDMTMSSIAFFQDRIGKDFRAMRDIMAARESAEYVRIGTDFWQTAWNDYRDQMMRVGDQMRELADDTEEYICETSDEVNRVTGRRDD